MSDLVAHVKQYPRRDLVVLTTKLMSRQPLDKRRWSTSAYTTVGIDEDLRLVVVGTQVPWLLLRIELRDVVLRRLRAKDLHELVALASAARR